jgi:hypothetical protein
MQLPLAASVLLLLHVVSVLTVNPLAPNLRSAVTYAVLAGTGVTSTGATVITGDLGTYPATSVTGPPTVSGAVHRGDGVAQQALADLVSAYNDLAGRTSDTMLATELGGATVAPGVISTASGTFQISAILTLDGQNLPSPVFIFKAATTLNTANAASVKLINPFGPAGHSSLFGILTI